MHLLLLNSPNLHHYCLVSCFKDQHDCDDHHSQTHVTVLSGQQGTALSQVSEPVQLLFYFTCALRLLLQNHEKLLLNCMYVTKNLNTF